MDSQKKKNSKNSQKGILHDGSIDVFISESKKSETEEAENNKVPPNSSTSKAPGGKQNKGRKRKAPNGSGSCRYRKAEKRWEWSLWRAWKGGPVTRRSFYGSTQAEAREKMLLAVQKDEQLVGVWSLHPERATVEQFFTFWLEQEVKTRNAYHTYKMYQSVCKNHLFPRFGDLLPKQVNAMSLTAHFNDLRARGKKPKTVNAFRTVLMIAFNRAVELNLVARNVVKQTKPLPEEVKEAFYFTRAQVDRLLYAMKGDPEEALIVTALSYGLRAGEVSALQWSDVDFEAQTLTVNKTVFRQDGKWVSGPTKGRNLHMFRLIPKVAALLKAHRIKQFQARQEIADRWDTSWNLVFCTTSGRPLCQSVITRRFKRHLEVAKLPDATMHALRHTFAGLLIGELDLNLFEVQTHMRHKQVTTTEKYKHIERRRQDSTMLRIDEMLSQ